MEGASKYQVYRSTTGKDGSFSLIKTLTGTSFVNTGAEAGTTYWYKVRAVHTNTAANSALSAAKYRACDLAKPTGVTSSNIAYNGKIQIKWNPVEGAEKYYVYRSEAKDGSYEIINTVTDTQCINYNAQAGKLYYYKVKALHSDSAANSAISGYTSRTCDLPAPEINMSMDAVTCQPVVLWSAIEGAAGYEISRSATGDAGSFVSVGKADNTQFTDTEAAAGDVYHYRVRALASNTAAHSAYSEAKMSVGKLSAPVISITKNEDGNPVISWDKQEGAVEYQVYRALSADGTYKLAKTTTSTKYTNTSALEAVEYFYKVKAVAANEGYSSPFSQVVSIVAGSTTEQLKTMYVANATINVYTEPVTGTGTTVLIYMDEVQLGADVSVSDEGRWTRLFCDGKLYYVWTGAGESKFTDTKSSFEYTSENNTDLQNAVVEFAIKWKDEPTFYTHGQSNGILDESVGKYGFDCSGFATFVLETVMQKENPLYAVSSNLMDFYSYTTLYNKGFDNQFDVADISLDDIQAGDIIFFKQDETDSNVVDHCAVYLGNSEIIHAVASPDGVYVAPLDDDRIANIVKIRRYLPENAQPANQTLKTNYEWTYIYETNNVDAQCLYDFELGEEVTLLYTSSTETWGYIRSKDGLEGYVLMERFDKVE